MTLSLALRTALVVLVGAAALALAPGARPVAEPAGELAFARDGVLYVARADGSRVRRLAAGSTPAWSPDGKRLAFHRYVRGRNSELYVVDATGRNLRRLTVHPAEELWPAWSPDGKRLAFVSTRAGNWEVYVMDADGRDVRRVTRRQASHEVNVTPAWSPDGRLLVFSSTRTFDNAEIYVVRPDGTGLRRLTRTKGDTETLGDDGFPAWSPDGKRIVFTSNRTADNEIWVMRRDGSGQRRLVGLPRRDDVSPELSPDGRRLAFHSLGGDGKSVVYVARADGGGLKALFRGEDPAWRP